MTEPIVRTVHVAAPPEVVFDYFVDDQKIVRWKAVESTTDPRPGGLYRLNVTGRVAAAGEFIEVEPPKRLVYTWGWEGNTAVPPGSSRVEVTFEPENGGTLVRVVHSGLPDDEQAAQHAVGWEHYFLRLTVVAVGGDPGPDPWAG